MSNITYTNISNKVTLVPTVAILLDGSVQNMDGTAIAAGDIIYPMNNVSAAERQLYVVPTTTTGALVAVPNTQVSLQNSSVSLAMNVLKGTANKGLHFISDVSTGIFDVPVAPSVPQFGTLTNGGYSTTAGIFKYVTTTTISIPSGQSLDVVSTFATGGSTVPFTTFADMAFEGITFTNSTGFPCIVVAKPITGVSTVTVTITNTSTSDISGGVLRINVSQYA
jgi:hypothetical protein